MGTTTNTIERAVVRRLLRDLLAAGYAVSVHDGEEMALERSTSLAEIEKALCATDEDTEDTLHVYVGSELSGFVRLVYGNDGTDVMSDWSPSSGALNDLIERGALALAERIENGTAVLEEVA